MSTYEAWRITYKSSEAAARAAYNTVEKLHAELVELKEQMQAIGAGGVEPLRKTSADTSALRAALEEAEAALEVATSRLSARGANYPVHVTSEARALEIVRHALGKSHADHFRDATEMMLPTAQVLEPVEQRQLDIGKAIERACQELPEGAEIQIYLERGAGTVHMTDWDGNEFDHFDEDHDDFACAINAATDGAIAAEQVAAHVKQGGQHHDPPCQPPGTPAPRQTRPLERPQRRRLTAPQGAFLLPDHYEHSFCPTRQIR